MAYTFDDNQFSDLYKEAFGFRPDSEYFEWLEQCSAAEKQCEWDHLIRMVNILDAE